MGTRLKKIINNSILSESPALLHLCILQAAEDGWDGYLKYWRKEYKNIADVARYSKVGIAGSDRFNSSFKDIQHLELIRQKLLTSSVIIAGYLETAAGCIDFCAAMNVTPEMRDTMKFAMETCLRRMQMHARSVQLLLSNSEETGKVVSASQSHHSYSGHLLIVF